MKSKVMPSLGERCAATLLRRIDEIPLTSSNRHVLDYLPKDASAAIFDALMARADKSVGIPIPDDNGRAEVIRLPALSLARADLIPFFVDDAVSETSHSRGSEGFASCLRDHYVVNAERPRFLLTITARGNETQKSAQDGAADRSLLNLKLLLNTVMDERGVDVNDPLRRVADVYLSFRNGAETWSETHARWEHFLEEVGGGAPSEQGAKLPLLGCFLPDRTDNFVEGSRVRILPDSEDLKRRRSGDSLSETRLWDNALLRSYLADVFQSPIEDPEHVLGEVFEEAPEKAKVIAKGGCDGLNSLDLGVFSGMDQVQKHRKKNALEVDTLTVEHAHCWRQIEHVDSRILVVAADRPITVRLSLQRGFNSRKERAQIAGWNATKGKIELWEVSVPENAQEVPFQIEPPSIGEFGVYRLALTKGPRTLRNPIDSILVGFYGASTAEILIEEKDRELSLNEQAWLTEEDFRFVRCVSRNEAGEPITIAESVELRDSPTIEGSKIEQLSFVGTELKTAIVKRRSGDIDADDGNGSFEHEDLLELAAYTVKVGERTRKAFQASPYYLDAVRQIDENGSLWRVDLDGGISREVFSARRSDEERFLYERAVARMLDKPEILTLQWSRDVGLQAAAVSGMSMASWNRFLDARKVVLGAIREIAKKLVPRYRRDLVNAGVPLWLLPLHQVSEQIDAYLVAWSTAVDEAMETTRYETIHDHLLQLDTLTVTDDGSSTNRLVLLPTNPWLLALLLRYQSVMTENFRPNRGTLPLRREEVEQLVPKTALEEWYLAQRGGIRLRLTDSAPFHLEFLPEDGHKSRGTLDYVRRVVANKIERYLRMHPPLRNEHRTLRIGFVNPGDGQHLLEGVRQWLIHLMRERHGRLRILPSEEIPSIDVFLFSTEGEDNELGSAFEQFFREQVAAAEDDVVKQAMVARIRYRKGGQKGPASPADSVHICFVNGLVDARQQSNKTGPLAEWWDGGFGDGLLATYLRRALPGASGQLHSRRGLWLNPNANGLRGALARLVALQRGCRDSDLDRAKAIYWECPLPDVASLGNVYRYSDWVVHLDRELSLELFTRNHDAPTIIEYSDQEVLDSPGYDTITVTRNAKPYHEQLGEILTTVALDIQGRGDAAHRAAQAILGDINVLSGSWALDFLMGSIAGKSYSLRLKGNIGAALVYRWMKRVERLPQGSVLLDAPAGKVVPVLISLEELLRVTPASGFRRKDGLVDRYTNESEDDKNPAAKHCDDLLVLYLPRSEEGLPTRIFGRVIEVKFGTTAVFAKDKAIQQVRTTNELLQKHLSGSNSSVEAPFRHKQLSLLLKAQLEQAVSMKVLEPDIYDFLNVPVLSANLATGNYDVEYTFGIDGQHVLGDAFLLDTRDNKDEAVSTRIENGVRIVTLPRGLVEWLTFELNETPTLIEKPSTTLPRLGRYENVQTQPGNSRRGKHQQLLVATEPTKSAAPNNETRERGQEELPSIVAVEANASAEQGVGAEPNAIAAMPVAEAILPANTLSVSTEAPERTVVPDPASRITLDDACRTPVKLAPYPDSAVLDIVMRLERALRGHKVGLASPLSVRETDRGPRLLRVYVRLEAGESIQALRRMSEDLAREVGTESTDLHVSNVPERHAVGLDLPVRGLSYSISFQELVAHASFLAAQEELTLGFCAGVDVTGRPIWTDLVQMPHMLVAGTTGSGKTIFLRNVILTLLVHNPPERMILRLSSSKPMDFRIFTQAPHAGGVPMATNATEALQIARQLVDEMDRRIELISEAMCDNLAEYNRENPAQALPYIVGVFDEYAEMMASFGDRAERAEFEAALGRLAQKARAAGIHLILCMQRPDANALKGTIKANVLHRFALKLPQSHDSQVILDESGAETLLGQGDLLYKDANSRVYRLQVPNLENAYLKKVMQSFKDGGRSPVTDPDGIRECPKCGRSGTVREVFGTRRMRYRRRDGFEVVTERPQSYCRDCRSGGHAKG